MRALAARLCAGTEHHSAVETNEQSCSAQRGLAAEDNRSIDSVDVASIPFGQDYCSAGQACAERRRELQAKGWRAKGVRRDHPRHVPDSKTCRGRFRHYRRRSLKNEMSAARARVWLEDRREGASSLSRPLVSTPALHRVRQMSVPDEWSDDLTDLDDEVDELEDEQPVASTSKSAAKAAKGAGKQSLRPPRTVSYSAQSLFGTLSPHYLRSVVWY
jgi:hypothetical protein